jgi:hypothetical protein
LPSGGAGSRGCQLAGIVDLDVPGKRCGDLVNHGQSVEVDVLYVRA